MKATSARGNESREVAPFLGGILLLRTYLYDNDTLTRGFYNVMT